MDWPLSQDVAIKEIVIELFVEAYQTLLPAGLLLKRGFVLRVW